MVSTGILSTSLKEIKLSGMDSVKKDAQTLNDDFTQILNNQKDNLRTRDNIYGVKSDNKNNEKTEEIRNLFKKSDVKEIEKNNDDNFEDEAITEIMGYFQNVIEKLEKEYDVSKEDVIGVMKELNLEPKDLFEMQNISKLVMAMSGSDDMSALLVDDNMSNLIKEIFADAEDVINSLKSEYGFSDEELSGLFEKISNFSEFNLQNEEVKTYENEDNLTVDENVSSNLQHTENEIKELLSGSATEDTSDREAEKGSNESGENVHNSFGEVTMENVISNIEEALNNSESVKESGLSEKILNQILDGIYANISEKETSLELQLNPESLGKVNVTVSAKEGILTAHISTQTEIAKEAIESQIMVLKESFETQGLKVEEIEVTISSRSFDQNFGSDASKEENGSKSKKHISQEEIDEINGIRRSDAEIPTEEVLKELGTTVSYTA